MKGKREISAKFVEIQNYKKQQQQQQVNKKQQPLRVRRLRLFNGNASPPYTVIETQPKSESEPAHSLLFRTPASFTSFLLFCCLLYLLPSLLLLLLLHGIHICFCVLDITHTHTNTRTAAKLHLFELYFQLRFSLSFFLLLFACGRKKKPRRFSLLFETSRSRSRCRRQRCCSSAVCLGQQARHRPIHLFACACLLCVCGVCV